MADWSKTVSMLVTDINIGENLNHQRDKKSPTLRSTISYYCHHLKVTNITVGYIL